MNYKEVERKTGITKSTLIRENNKIYGGILNEEYRNKEFKFRG